MSLTRREACILIPAMMTAATSYGAKKNAEPAKVLRSATYNFKDLHAIKDPEHNTYPIFNGKTNAGVPLELHETELAPGAQPHPPHRHRAEELFLVREGMVQVTIDGKTIELGAGSVAYIASNALHGIRNAVVNGRAIL